MEININDTNIVKTCEHFYPELKYLLKHMFYPQAQYLIDNIECFNKLRIKYYSCLSNILLNFRTLTTFCEINNKSITIMPDMLHYFVDHCDELLNSDLADEIDNLLSFQKINSTQTLACVESWNIKMQEEYFEESMHCKNIEKPFLEIVDCISTDLCKISLTKKVLLDYFMANTEKIRQIKQYFPEFIKQIVLSRKPNLVKYIEKLDNNKENILELKKIYGEEMDELVKNDIKNIDIINIFAAFNDIMKILKENKLTPINHLINEITMEKNVFLSDPNDTAIILILHNLKFNKYDLC